MSSVLPGAAFFMLFVLASWFVTWLVFRLPGGSRASTRGPLRRLAPGRAKRGAEPGAEPGANRRDRRGARRRARGRAAARVTVVPARPARPIEDIVSDARRYASRVHEPPRGTSFAKHAALCNVYDRVLGEACAALDIEHLLGVLPPGEERDAERTRIETALWLAGLRLEDAA